jgi:hypothetical protein
MPAPAAMAVAQEPVVWADPERTVVRATCSAPAPAVVPVMAAAAAMGQAVVAAAGEPALAFTR